MPDERPVGGVGDLRAWRRPVVHFWRFGTCVVCGTVDSWYVVTLPREKTGEQFPVFGKCDACGHVIDLKGDPPFLVVDPDDSPPQAYPGGI